MAAGPTAQIATKAVQAAKTALDSVADAVKKEDGEKDAGSSASKAVEPPKVESGLDSGAAAAAERFRKTTRWALGAFAAVGVLVFGSLPFTDITGSGRDLFQIIPGLAAAAAGISLAIWAVSRVDEPEDASLGELDADLPDAKDTMWNPRKRALFRLKEILRGNDGRSHVGPVYPGVEGGSSAESRISGLIQSIGKAQTDRYDQSAEVAEKRVALDAAEKALEARTKELEAAWGRWVKAVELANPPPPKEPGAS